MKLLHFSALLAFGCQPARNVFARDAVLVPNFAVRISPLSVSLPGRKLRLRLACDGHSGIRLSAQGRGEKDMCNQGVSGTAEELNAFSDRLVAFSPQPGLESTLRFALTAPDGVTSYAVRLSTATELLLSRVRRVIYFKETYGKTELARLDPAFQLPEMRLEIDAGSAWPDHHYVYYEQGVVYLYVVKKLANSAVKQIWLRLHDPQSGLRSQSFRIKLVYASDLLEKGGDPTVPALVVLLAALFLFIVVLLATQDGQALAAAPAPAPAAEQNVSCASAEPSAKERISSCSTVDKEEEHSTDSSFLPQLPSVGELPPQSPAPRAGVLERMKDELDDYE